MKIALVNSRKPRLLSGDEPWLRTTMSLGYALARSGHTLCASVGTLGYEAALFGAAKGGGKIEAFVLPHETSGVEQCLPRGTPPNLVSIHPVDSFDLDPELERDRVVMNAADLVIAVAIRANGHMEAFLEDLYYAGADVQIVPPLEEGPLWRGTQRLLELGVPMIEDRFWQWARDNLEIRQSLAKDEPEWASFFPSWRDAPLTTPTLSHFTRGTSGPWPGQTQSEYLEDLWHGGIRARRDAPAVLWRIVSSGILKASTRLIRGRFPVVSFTAASLESIDKLHRYRRHLVRWDFEPWGIVFDREWLTARGARAVKYLPTKGYQQLPKNERPLFQKHAPPKCDYSQEEEWRVVGDLHFADVPPHAVRLVLGS